MIYATKLGSYNNNKLIQTIEEAIKWSTIKYYRKETSNKEYQKSQFWFSKRNQNKIGRGSISPHTLLLF